jgi:hypothetical protein
MADRLSPEVVEHMLADLVSNVKSIAQDMREMRHAMDVERDARHADALATQHQIDAHTAAIAAVGASVGVIEERVEEIRSKKIGRGQILFGALCSAVFGFVLWLGETATAALHATPKPH